MLETTGRNKAVGSKFGSVSIGRDDVQVKANAGTDVFVSPDRGRNRKAAGCTVGAP